MVFNFKRLYWALRKVQLPVGENAIVLDVGSGGNPHPRSDVLLDRLTGSEHRCGNPMLIDRPAVIGDATKLPFKDKSFDFIIASHILEHMPNPEVFLSELQRVGKAGYIETPNFVCERFVPCEAHCLEVGLVNDTLQIHKKAASIEDKFFSGMDFLSADKNWKNLYFSDPAMFHVRYFWNDEIKYRIDNPEISCEWVGEIYKNSKATDAIIESVPRGLDWRSIGAFFYGLIQKRRRSKRLKEFDMFSILACPECKGDLKKIDGGVHCVNCSIDYSFSPFINFERPLA